MKPTCSCSRYSPGSSSGGERTQRPSSEVGQLQPPVPRLDSRTMRRGQARSRRLVRRHGPSSPADRVPAGATGERLSFGRHGVGRDCRVAVGKADVADHQRPATQEQRGRPNQTATAIALPRPPRHGRARGGSRRASAAPTAVVTSRGPRSLSGDNLVCRLPRRSRMAGQVDGVGDHRRRSVGRRGVARRAPSPRRRCRANSCGRASRWWRCRAPDRRHG